MTPPDLHGRHLSTRRLAEGRASTRYSSAARGRAPRRSRPISLLADRSHDEARLSLVVTPIDRHIMKPGTWDQDLGLESEGTRLQGARSTAVKTRSCTSTGLSDAEAARHCSMWPLGLCACYFFLGAAFLGAAFLGAAGFDEDFFGALFFTAMGLFLAPRHTCLSPTGMNRPVPAPIHTKSLNFWKTNLKRFHQFLVPSRSRLRTVHRLNRYTSECKNRHKQNTLDHLTVMR